MGCTHNGCDRLHKAKGFCHAHYQQWKRFGETWDFGLKPHRGRKPCTFPGCGKDRAARGLCASHAAQVRRGQELRELAKPRPEAAEGYAFCSTCKRFWPIDCFSWRSNRGQPQPTCMDCRATSQRELNRKPSVIRSRRASRLRTSYGIEPAEYSARYTEQNGCCAICTQPIPNLLEDLDVDMRKGSGVDHCHTTGQVRGLLCSGCNRGLGSFDDDVERLQRAIDYLRIERGQRVADLTSRAEEILTRYAPEALATD